MLVARKGLVTHLLTNNIRPAGRLVSKIQIIEKLGPGSRGWWLDHTRLKIDLSGNTLVGKELDAVTACFYKIYLHADLEKSLNIYFIHYLENNRNA